MPRLDLQFYAFFMTVLCGAVLGLLFDLLRVARGRYRPNWLMAGLADLLFWLVATAALSGALFYGNWGEIRFYVLVGILGGASLYMWMASPVVIYLTRALFYLFEWIVQAVISAFLRLIWYPLVAILTLLFSTILMLWRWAEGLASWLLLLLYRIGTLAARPLIGPYCFCRLHYLLIKRRMKRQLRRWLLGPSRPPRR